MLFGLFPLAFLALTFYAAYSENVVAIDFHYVYYPGAQDVLDGDSPFVDVDDPRKRFIYTPLVAFLVTPFTVLPLAVADALVSVLLVALWVATPYVFGVRDWRVAGVVLLWAPFVSGLQTANVTLLLVFLCGLAWRWRDRKVLAGLSVGLAIGFKLFLWPLAVWLLATRRVLSFLVASAVTAFSILLVLPYETLGEFTRILREQGELFDVESYTLYALLVELGAPDVAARAAWLGIGLSVLFFGRRSFSLCVAAALLLSPIVWLHYYAFLLVPLAIASAPLWMWFIPVPLAFVPGASNGGAADQIVVLAVFAVTVWLCLQLDSPVRRLHSRVAQPGVPRPADSS
jgi:hypothetical protein